MSTRGWLFAGISMLGVLASLWAARIQSDQGTKYAFLVGCGQYFKTEFRSLPYTARDVEGFKRSLLATGFEADHVVVLHDNSTETRYRPLKSNILQELGLILTGMRPQDMLVLALSGHGLHFKGDTTGYFVPVDGKLGDKSTLIPMEGKGGLFELLKACKAKRKLLIVNACRNDPSTDVAFAATKIQLDDEDSDQVPEGIAAIYSCKQGEKSYYDPDRKLAIFFDHVNRAWQGEYQKGAKVSLENFFEHVIVKTKADANKTLQVSQVPVVRREYQGEWVIHEGGAVVPSLPPVKVDLGGTGQKMKLVRIEPGTFTMGSPTDEKDREDSEFQHTVEISKPFYMSAHEVTVGQFRAFVDDAGYKTEAEKDGEGGYGYDADAKKFEGRNPKYNWRSVGFEQTDDHPVVNVSWNDAKAFCAWLSRKDGKNVDLPTEAEWEYACRAGTKTRFTSGDGDASLEGHGNVADASSKAFPGIAQNSVFFSFDDGFPTTAPVGRFKANSWGLFDMHGNVWEWCKDWHDKDYYKNSPGTDPQGPAEGKLRVRRGGSWIGAPSSCRAAYRGRFDFPDFRQHAVGFRVVVRLEKASGIPVGTFAGMTKEEAEKAIMEQGFKPNVRTGDVEAPKTGDEKIVYEQNPKPGDFASKGDPVTVSLYKSKTAFQEDDGAFVDPRFTSTTVSDGTQGDAGLTATFGGSPGSAGPRTALVSMNLPKAIPMVGYAWLIRKFTDAAGPRQVIAKTIKDPRFTVKDTISKSMFGEVGMRIPVKDIGGSHLRHTMQIWSTVQPRPYENSSHMHMFVYREVFLVSFSLWVGTRSHDFTAEAQRIAERSKMLIDERFPAD